MNLVDVIESAMRTIIRSGRDVKVTFNLDGALGRTIEINGFNTDDVEDEGSKVYGTGGISDGDLACEYCRFSEREEHEHPCNSCIHNAFDRFERRDDAETD